MKNIHCQVEDSVFEQIITYLNSFGKEKVIFPDLKTEIEIEEEYIKGEYQSIDLTNKDDWMTMEEMKEFLDSQR